MAEPDQSSAAEPKKRPSSGNKAIGNRLKAARKKLGLDQVDVARTLDVSKAAVSQWESGKTAIDPKRIQGISVLLGIPIQDLVDLPPGMDYLTSEERFLLDRFRVAHPETRQSLLVLLGRPKGDG